jgi:hypothetical protein
MVVPNLVFDAILFGLLIAGAAVDSAFPILHGIVSLLVIGGATYWAAQEMSDVLLRRAGWTQESLATSVALSVGGFIYFWWRNQSDLVLLVLSIGLMMASLMVTISILGAIGSAFREGQPTPVTGWVATLGGSVILGTLAGVAALVLGTPTGGESLTVKMAAVGLALVLWKARERTSPPAANPHYQNIEAQKSVGVAPTLPQGRVAIFPQHGTLLDRLLCVLVLGVFALVLAQRTVSSDQLSTIPPAVASQTADK